jgi:integrase/recombinase XerD
MSTTKYVNVDKALQNLEDSELDSENIDSIQRFINESAAEGLSEVRQRRLITALKAVIKNCAPEDFTLSDASEAELKQTIAALHRHDDYTESTKHTMKGAVKKFYKVENGGHEHPEKVDFFTVHQGQSSTVSREDLFTDEELKQLFRSFSNTRDRALTMVLYESGARPGEVLSRNLADFTSNEKGDFIYLEGLKGTPDRTNQLVRAGRTVREWISQHPLGGEMGDIEDPSAPLWVKTEQQTCQKCGNIPHKHGNSCSYEPDLADRLSYDGFLRRFKDACERADIPENKRRPYNLRHTRLTEVATFMGYEQLNKFAGWKPGSDRAKVYVHLNNDDVNKAIRDKYGLDTSEDEESSTECPFCGSSNEHGHSECRTCGRPLSLKQKAEKEEKQEVLERLSELQESGVLEKLESLQSLE